MKLEKSAAATLGKGFAGKTVTLSYNTVYLVKDFADGSIVKGNSREVSDLIGINRSCVSTYCRNNQVYKGRFRITEKDNPDWTTDMKKIRVKCS